MVLGLVALQKRGDRSLSAFVVAGAGKYLLLAVFIIGIAALLLARQVRDEQSRVKIVAGFGLNFWSVLLVFIAAEGSLRLLTTKTVAGPSFGHIQLLPKSWSAVAAHNQDILARARREGSFLVFDPELGWTIAKNAHSRDYTLNEADKKGKEAAHKLGYDRDGTYASSIEGLRSAHAGMSLTSSPHRKRIALVGDSFTFGLEVSYEDTWGEKLERAIGHDVQVLNFGVDGYGVDQAYLRYLRDVTPWHPDIVILSVINDDLRRSMCVYSFLCFGGFETPFPKPRFVVAHGELTQVNNPLPTPASLFGYHSIGALPFVDLDGSYDPIEWTSRASDGSYAARLLLTHFRRWPAINPAISDSAMREVNTELFAAFVRSVKENGSVPVIVRFPSHTDLARAHPEPGRAGEVLRSAGIEYVNMEDCVRRVDASVRLVRTHYSATTNGAVAKCLYDALGERHLLP